jgi:hypothetical protein
MSTIATVSPFSIADALERSELRSPSSRFERPDGSLTGSLEKRLRSLPIAGTPALQKRLAAQASETLANAAASRQLGGERVHHLAASQLIRTRR